MVAQVLVLACGGAAGRAGGPHLPHKNPMPVGPHILCAEATIKSAPRVWTSTGMLGTARTRTQCEGRVVTSSATRGLPSSPPQELQGPEFWRTRLAAIQEQLGANGVRHLRHACRRQRAPQHVGHVNKADELGARGDQLSQLLDINLLGVGGQACKPGEGGTG